MSKYSCGLEIVHKVNRFRVKYCEKECGRYDDRCYGLKSNNWTRTYLTTRAFSWSESNPIVVKGEGWEFSYHDDLLTCVYGNTKEGRELAELSCKFDGAWGIAKKAFRFIREECLSVFLIFLLYMLGVIGIIIFVVFFDVIFAIHMAPFLGACLPVTITALRTIEHKYAHSLVDDNLLDYYHNI